MSLTGRTRCRPHRRFLRPTLIVLQVEEIQTLTEDLGGSGYYDDWQKIFWRDARPGDFDAEYTLKKE